MIRSPGIRRAAGVLALLAMGLLAACAPSTRWQDLRGPEGAAVGAHAAAVRFVHGSYVSPASTPEPQAFCLSVPLVSQVAVRAGDGAYPDARVPSPRLMSRLAELDPPVLLPERCVSGDDSGARLVAGGGPAASIRLGMAEWQGADEVMIPVGVLEATHVGLRLSCRVVKTLEGWEVAECLSDWDA